MIFSIFAMEAHTRHLKCLLMTVLMMCMTNFRFFSRVIAHVTHISQYLTRRDQKSDWNFNHTCFSSSFHPIFNFLRNFRIVNFLENLFSHFLEIIEFYQDEFSTKSPKNYSVLSEKFQQLQNMEI